MTSRDAISHAIALLGGPVKAAEALGLPRYQNVQQWLLSGRVPPKHCPSIERLTGGEVRCEQICPDVDWGFLRGTDCKTPTESREAA